MVQAALNEASSGRRWAILALLFATRVGLGLQFQTLGSVADPLAKDLHLSFTQIGTLIGLFMIPGLVLAIPLGFAGRYASDRALVAAGLAALALGGGVAAAADDFGLLALGRLLCGVGFVVTTIFFTKMVVDWFAGRELATAMAVLVMSWPFGIAMGQVLVAGGLGMIEAASIISLASWVMIFSGAACGQLADRSGRSDLILSACLVVAMGSLALLSHVAWAVPLSLLFGLIGMAPAGLIMALTGAAMAPHKRAFGMGIFFGACFVVTAPAPAIAGWLFDRSHDPFLPILFAIALFALTLGANFAFRIAERKMR